MRIYVEEKQNTYGFTLIDFDGNDISENVVCSMVHFTDVNNSIASYLDEETMAQLETDTHYCVPTKEVYNTIIRAVKLYQGVIDGYISEYTSGGMSRDMARELARIR